MIDAKNLRLGNIFWEDYGGYKVVTAIGCNAKGEMPNTVSARALNNTVSGQFSCEHIYGIELTGELLIKCGFTQGNYHENWFSHVELSPHIVVYDDGLILEMVDDIRISESFKYLHQLQNIFWCLSGKELEVNL